MVMVMRMLEGKSVVVTGAARGLGAEIAATCVRHGATVVIADVLADELEATAGTLGEAATAWPLDVTDADAWQRISAELRRTIGRPDALVNNAGIVRAKSLIDSTVDDLEASLAVNVRGTFLGMQMFTRLHLETECQRPGSIVNIASVRGLIGGAATTTYSASKFAVRGLTKAAAVELGAMGIRVNTVCPGPIESDMSVGNPQLADLDWEGYVAQLPIPRLGRPVDVAEAVAWLASDASAFVTGVDMPVDGGLTATSFGVTKR
jgi:3alpha(or 20beta)-hydroxysteroid dehydrogenase